MTRLSIDQALDLAIARQKAGELDLAASIYAQILQQHPTEKRVLHLLATVATQKGEMTAAQRLIGQALMHNPTDPAVHAAHALILSRQGKLDQAIEAWRHALTIKPDYAEAHYGTGLLLAQSSRLEEAIDAYRKAAALQPEMAAYHFALGTALYQKGVMQEAAEAFARTLEIQPDHAVASNDLGGALLALGRMEPAIDAYRRAIALRPDYPEAHYNLGVALARRRRLDEAEPCLRRAIALRQAYPQAHHNLGNLLFERGRNAEAIEQYRIALDQDANLDGARVNLGNALDRQGDFAAAIAEFRAALALGPDSRDACNNLGLALRKVGKIEEAVEVFRYGLAISADFPDAWNNLGTTLKDRGEHEQAMGCWDQAVLLKPDHHAAQSNRLYAMNFDPRYDAAAIGRELRRWNQAQAAPLKPLPWPVDNDPSLHRRLRIGYVSPDFCQQAESFFTVPLMENHDHRVFEIYCYSSVIKPDQITERLRKCADVWRDVHAESDEALAQIVRDDRIDILVDLTMHMGNNRALMFARKPAPVQVAWLAYPGSTGLWAMDYRITDSFMDAPDADTSCYTEQSIRLPNCWGVYDPMTDLPARPPEQTGPIIFGSLNSPWKLNDALLALWARILTRVPDSRLKLKVLSPDHRQRILRLMNDAGIGQDRLIFAGHLKRPEYLRSYDQIDIALDPLPYNGITTTCDALYMGTPVLTLAGQTACGRAGKAMLSTIGLTELVTHTPDEFVQRAAALAGDPRSLCDLRSILRSRMSKSPLMDGAKFARDMEFAYRNMWRVGKNVG